MKLKTETLKVAILICLSTSMAVATTASAYDNKAVVAPATAVAEPVAYTAPAAQTATGNKTGVYVAVGVAGADSSLRVSDSGSSTRMSHSGWAGNFGVGYDFSVNYDTPVRVDLRYNVNQNVKFDEDLSLKQHGFSSNIYYDFKNDTFIEPFVNVGIDYTKYKLNEYNVVTASKKIGLGVGAGVGLKLTNDVKLDLAVGAKWVPGRISSMDGDLRHTNKNASATLRYQF